MPPHPQPPAPPARPRRARPPGARRTRPPGARRALACGSRRRGALACRRARSCAHEYCRVEEKVSPRSGDQAALETRLEAHGVARDQVRAVETVDDAPRLRVVAAGGVDVVAELLAGEAAAA